MIGLALAHDDVIGREAACPNSLCVVRAFCCERVMYVVSFFGYSPTEIVVLRGSFCAFCGDGCMDVAAKRENKVQSYGGSFRPPHNGRRLQMAECYGKGHCRIHRSFGATCWCRLHKAVMQDDVPGFFFPLLQVVGNVDIEGRMSGGGGRGLEFNPSKKGLWRNASRTDSWDANFP